MRYLAVLLLMYSSASLAMFCPVVPDNFKIINSGDTIQTVLDTCGQPNSKKTHIKKINTSVSIPVGGGVTTGYINPYANSYSSQTSSPTYINQSSENEIEVTELYYQTAVLIFANGILVDQR